MEWLGFLDRVQARSIPLPRSIANLKRETSEKWVEARRRAGDRTSNKIQNPEKPEARQHRCWEHQEASLEVLLAENWAMPHQTVPTMS